jgi:hypothetical protein
MKNLPVPIPFLVVLVTMVLFVIFFGAWAVSADARSRENSLSFAIVSSGTSLGVGPYSPSQEVSSEGPGYQESDKSKADTWWGKSLIKACPVH